MQFVIVAGTLELGFVAYCAPDGEMWTDRDLAAAFAEEHFKGEYSILSVCEPGRESVAVEEVYREEWHKGNFDDLDDEELDDDEEDELDDLDDEDLAELVDLLEDLDDEEVESALDELYEEDEDVDDLDDLLSSAALDKFTGDDDDMD